MEDTQEIIDDTTIDFDKYGRSFHIKYKFEQIPDKESDEYEVIIFHKPNCKPDEIYTVHFNGGDKENERENRIGWIFPIKVFDEDPKSLSIQEEPKRYSAFCGYAYKAFVKLCNYIKEADEGKIPFRYDKKPSPSTLLNFYDDDSVVLVISKTRKDNYEVVLNEEFEIKNYLPSLLTYGYWLLKDKSACDFADKANENRTNQILVTKKFFISRNSFELDENKFIEELFTSLLIRQTNEIAEFHLLYQVIEILIENVFNFEVEQFPKKFSLEDSNFFKLRKELQLLTNEQNRITKLFENFQGENKKINLKDLSEACQKLLDIGNKEISQEKSPLEVFKEKYKPLIELSLSDKISILNEKENSVEAILDLICKNFGGGGGNSPLDQLYNVRSTIFHNYKKIGFSNSNLIKVINRELVDLVVSLIINYSLPGQKARNAKSSNIKTIEIKEGAKTIIRIVK